MNYKEELQRATNMLGEEGYIFLGQNMKFGGTSLYHMVKHLPEEQRLELPVMEDTQMGISAGMTLEGEKICSIFPRWDFMILAINQLVNHLDKAKLMSNGQFKLKGLIIRTCVGSIAPMFPGQQHCGDYTDAVKMMCKDIKVIKLEKAEDIVPVYKKAMESDVPTVIVEIPDLYNSSLIYDIEASKEVIK